MATGQSINLPVSAREITTLGGLIANSECDTLARETATFSRSITKHQRRRRNLGDRNTRRILVLNAVAGLSSLVPASEAGADPFVLSHGPESSLGQLLSGKPGDAGGDLSQDLPLLNDADSVFLGWRDVQAFPLARESQALLVTAQPRQLQVKSAPASSIDPAPAGSLNSKAIDASAGDTATGGLFVGPGSKGDRVLSSGMTGNPGSNLKNDGSLVGDGKNDFAPPAIRFETVGFAAAVLVSLWFVILVVIILVHAEQKSERRRRFFTSHGVPRGTPPSAIKPVARENWALRAQPDALPAYEQRLRDQSANVNAGRGAVHAA
jgi:hypothetical protein